MEAYYIELMEYIIDRGKSKLDECEVFLSTNKSTSIEIFKGEVSKYDIAESGGLSLRVNYKGRMGYAYTEKLDKTSVPMLINEAIENSKYMDGDKEYIYEGASEYRNVEEKDLLSNLSMEEKIKTLKKIEKYALDLDKRIRPNRFAYSESYNSRYIYNSKGLDLKRSSSSGAIYFSVIAENKGDIKTGNSSRLFKDFEEVKYKEIGEEAVKSALSMLGAKKIKSDNYKVIFENESFANLLASFINIFTADSVQKDLSLLKGKIGKDIASKKLTILDNPFLENAFGSRAFDDEGTATMENIIIKEGKLVSYLYNWKTALKDGVKSTGNAGRTYKGAINTTVNNFYIEKGKLSIEELLAKAESGIYIDSLQGLHSGLDPVSGDFSLSASGYKIKSGLKADPINQITVSGNFFDLLKNIEDLGNDLSFGLSTNGRIGSPSILIDKLSISGE